MHALIYPNMHTSIHTRIDACVFTCVYIYIYMCVCAYVYKHIHIHIYIYIHTHLCVVLTACLSAYLPVGFGLKKPDYTLTEFE